RPGTLGGMKVLHHRDELVLLPGQVAVEVESALGMARRRLEVTNLAGRLSEPEMSPASQMGEALGSLVDPLVHLLPNLQVDTCEKAASVEIKSTRVITAGHRLQELRSVAAHQGLDPILHAEQGFRAESVEPAQGRAQAVACVRRVRPEELSETPPAGRAVE